MVVGPPDHSNQADIVFVVEGTAINGAYINDLKTNYIIPSLEYFAQGNIEERDYISENSNAYGIVVYQAADCLPHPSSDTFGPFSNPARLLNAFEKLELIGGKGESHANIAEGLATTLQCFEELQHKREPGTPAQKHCILVCNSPPYSMPVMESYNYAGKTCEQLATLLQEKGINLSIISPRKIPALFKLFEKAGGDLSTSQTKNYAKDPRHLVLLKGFCLKERPISPPPGTMSVQSQLPTQPNIMTSLPSPLPNNDSPIMSQGAQQNPNILNQNPQTGVVPNPMGQPVFRPNQNNPGLPQAIPPHSQSMVPPMMARGQITNPQFPNQQLPAPPGYHPQPNMGTARAAPPRWPTMLPPQQRPPYIQQPNQQNNAQGSALIAQLTQPPSSMTATQNQFGQMAPNANQQMNPQQQQVIRMQMLNNQVPQNVQTSMANQTMQNQAAVSSQPTSTGVSPAPSVAPTQTGPSTAITSQAGQQPQQQRERPTIWHGVLEWIEKPKNPTDQQKVTRHVPCSVSANSKDGEPELKADCWPQKLIMQLMPKQLIGNIGGMYLRNSKSVLFHPQQCEALESLTKVMVTGFAGCVHFTSIPSPSACDIKVLILLYTAEKRAYLGFIPNDQAAFVDRLRKVIQQQKSNQLVRQIQVGSGVPQNQLGVTMANQMGNPQAPLGQGATNPATSQPPNQQGIMMSQTNTMAMGGGQITQNVVTSTSQQPNQQQNVGVLGQQGMNQQAPTSTPQMRPPNQMMQGQRPPFDHIAMERQQNLEKINQLKQTLEAAQQQEQQYKNQMEIINALQNAQQQELQFKMQMERQGQLNQQQMNPQVAPQVANPNQQRMMRPGLTNNPGLRHLLQQQPQYRQQLIGMQPMGGAGQRPQMGQQLPNAGGQQQQFDEVPNFEYM